MKSGSSLSKDTKKMDSINKKLRERVIDLENKKSSLNKKLIAANARIKYLEKQLPNKNIKDVNNKMKEFHKEISEMTTVESNISEQIMNTIKNTVKRCDNFKQ